MESQVSDLRHKSAGELRKEISYQAARIDALDDSISAAKERLRIAEEAVNAELDNLVKLRMKRNNHQQRLVWSKNYLIMKEGET